MAKTILKIEDLAKIYNNGVHALNHVSFDVKEGEFLAIIGLSGSGKSTLLRCINRLIEPSSGKIIFDGVDIAQLSSKDLRAKRKKMGMIFQHFNLIKRKTVLMNVLSGQLGSASTLTSLAGIFSPELREHARKQLELVGLAAKAGARADELSGGQQQRVAIARCLMQDPEILLADEPVASLDPATSHSVMQYLEKANKELGKTIVCNLHFLSLVRQYATRVIALKQGEIIFDGNAHEITDEWFRHIYGEEAREVEIR